MSTVGTRDLEVPDEVDDLARRASRGDEEAFARLCRRDERRLVAVCLRVLRDPHDARDAVQSAVARALPALRAGRLRGDVRPWLVAICRNEAISIARARRPWNELGGEEPAQGASPEAQVLVRERLEGVAADLAVLPARQRRAIVLREVADLPYDRVAALVGVTEQGARQAVCEARAALREQADGREASCASVRAVLGEPDVRRHRARRVRGHLRGCADCRAWQKARRGSRRHAVGAWILALLPGSWASSATGLLSNGVGAAVAGAPVRTVAVAAALAVGPGLVAGGSAPTPTGTASAATATTRRATVGTAGRTTAGAGSTGTAAAGPATTAGGARTAAGLPATGAAGRRAPAGRAAGGGRTGVVADRASVVDAALRSRRSATGAGRDDARSRADDAATTGAGRPASAGASAGPSRAAEESATGSGSGSGTGSGSTTGSRSDESSRSDATTGGTTAWGRGQGTGPAGGGRETATAFRRDGADDARSGSAGSATTATTATTAGPGGSGDRAATPAS